MRDVGGRKRRSEGRAEGGRGIDIGGREVGREREGGREVERKEGVNEGGSEDRTNGGR